jgi:hypothetical protein
MRVSASDPITRALPPLEVPTPTASAPTADASSPFAQVLRSLGREINSGEATTRAAIDSMRSGADLGPPQLIALQAGVYRYSEVIDLASRLVDRATAGVKTIMQGGGGP